MGFSWDLGLRRRYTCLPQGHICYFEGLELLGTRIVLRYELGIRIPWGAVETLRVYFKATDYGSRPWRVWLAGLRCDRATEGVNSGQG